PTPEVPEVNNAIVYLSATFQDAIYGITPELTYTWTGNGTPDGKYFTVAAAADKSIIAGTATVATSGSENHLDTTGEFKYPSLSAGQTLFIPEVFFVLPVDAAIDEVPEVTLPSDEELVEEAGTEAEAQAEGNDSDIAIAMNLTFVAEEGQEVQNIEAIEAEINAGTNGLAATRAISDANIKKILIAALNAQNIGIKNATYTLSNITVPAKSTTKIVKTPNYTKGEYTISVIIDGVTYNINKVIIRKVAGIKVKVTATTADGHSHDLHGNNVNAGGGIGGK
ncbi:MAG: hypothetical protein ACRC8J_04070, partial [Phocaeicola sp.]